MGGTVERAELDQIERVLNHELKARFAGGAVQRGVLGTGVVPDIAVPEAEACDVAYARALRHVLALDDLFPPIEDEARDALAGLPATACALAESV
jgi:hypothetical protein